MKKLTIMMATAAYAVAWVPATVELSKNWRILFI